MPVQFRPAWPASNNPRTAPTSMVPVYRQQMAAATPAYRPPPTPTLPAYPGQSNLGSAASMNEGDLAAHLSRQMSPYSPMARYGQAQQYQGQVNTQANQIAARRTLASPAMPTPPAPMIGIANAPPARIGLANMPVAPQAPVPGRDVPFVPSVIEEQKNTWRKNQGSSTANWRLHPGMVPPPPESLPVARTNARGAVAASPATASGVKVALHANLLQQMSQAVQSGDGQAMAEIGSQMNALGRNGFDGLLDHQHKQAMASAEREQIGAKIGVLDRSNGGRIGIAPDQAYQSAIAKTGDPQAAGEAYQWARISQADAAAKASGQPVQVDPNDAGLILNRKYPMIAQHFGTDTNGAATVGGLPELYSHIQAIQPPGWNDPKSEFSQAAAAKVRQLYGSELPSQLYLPSSPDQNQAIANVTGGSQWLGGVASNLARGHFTLFPGSDYEKRRPAVDWFNRVTSGR